MEEPTTDLMRGARAIAAYLQWTVRQVYDAHEKGNLPTFKLGHILYARRSALAAHFAKLEAARG